MFELLSTATSFAVGGAGAVLVVYLGTHPLAFTHPVGQPPAVAAVRPVAAAPIAVEPPPHEVVLPVVRITASVANLTKTKQTAMPVGFGPCAEWNDVGAVFIAPTGATGVRRVRALCAKPSDER